MVLEDAVLQPLGAIGTTHVQLDNPVFDDAGIYTLLRSAEFILECD